MQKLSQTLLSMSFKNLEKESKIKVQILPDKDHLHNHFARSIADEIKSNNSMNQPTRLILPVGPTEHRCNHMRV